MLPAASSAACSRRVSGLVIPKDEISIRPDRPGLKVAEVLVDPGDTVITGQTLARLAAVGEAPENLDAILITHEHSDHVCGLVVLAKQLNVPIFITRLTAPAIPWGASP